MAQPLALQGYYNTKSKMSLPPKQRPSGSTGLPQQKEKIDLHLLLNHLFSFYREGRTVALLMHFHRSSLMVFRSGVPKREEEPYGSKSWRGVSDVYNNAESEMDRALSQWDVAKHFRLIGRDTLDQEVKKVWSLSRFLMEFVKPLVVNEVAAEAALIALRALQPLFVVASPPLWDGLGIPSWDPPPRPSSSDTPTGSLPPSMTRSSIKADGVKDIYLDVLQTIFKYCCWKSPSSSGAPAPQDYFHVCSFILNEVPVYDCMTKADWHVGQVVNCCVGTGSVRLLEMIVKRYSQSDTGTLNRELADAWNAKRIDPVRVNKFGQGEFPRYSFRPVRLGTGTVSRSTTNLGQVVREGHMDVLLWLVKDGHGTLPGLSRGLHQEIVSWPEKTSLLMEACHGGSTIALRVLFPTTQDEIEQACGRRDGDGWTVLHYAAAGGRATTSRAVQRAEERADRTNAGVSKSSTISSTSVMHGVPLFSHTHSKAYQLLVTLECLMMDTPTCGSEGSHAFRKRVLLKPLSADGLEATPDNLTLVHIAAHYNHGDAFALLWGWSAEGAGISPDSPEVPLHPLTSMVTEGWNGCPSLLDVALASDAPWTLQELNRLSATTPNVTGQGVGTLWSLVEDYSKHHEKMRLVHMCVVRNAFKCLRWVLSCPGQAEVTTRSGLTAFHLAARDNRAQCMSVLLERHVHAMGEGDGQCHPLLRVTGEGDSRRTPLHVAFYRNATETVKVILGHCVLQEDPVLLEDLLKAKDANGQGPRDLAISEMRLVVDALLKEKKE